MYSKEFERDSLRRTTREVSVPCACDAEFLPATSGQIVLAMDAGDAPARALRSRLLSRQLGVVHRSSLAEGLCDMRRQKPDLVIIDLDLNDQDGLDALAEIRATTNVPIFAFSSRTAARFRIEALDLGANDVIAKPFDCDEAVARIRSALRLWSSNRAARSLIDLGELQIDRAQHEIKLRGRELRLTAREFAILSELAAHAGKVVSHRQLLSRVWGCEDPSRIGSLRVFIRELRRKIERDPADPALLINVPGLGYKLCGAADGANGGQAFASAHALAAHLTSYAEAGRTVFLKEKQFLNLAAVNAAADLVAAELGVSFVIETNPDWKGAIVHFDR